ncbi:MAG: hypothetical protein HOC23_17060 [Halieaceae bacterium]|jgi:hypothetical protein|nr:hypothetical protein [Halieaceae bacterium]
MTFLWRHRSGVFWGVAIALYLRFLLEPTAWLFYEIHHLTGVDWVYWGYSGFRGAAYYFSTWPYQGPACVVAGLLVCVIVVRGTAKVAGEAV